MSNEKIKYVWLKPDGSFSDSWDKEDQDELVGDDMITKAKEDGWKLIEYKELTDSGFEFYNMMRLA